MGQQEVFEDAAEEIEKFLRIATNVISNVSEKGIRIGTGVIESARRTIIRQRLKLSGQRWTKPGAQQILNLR